MTTIVVTAKVGSDGTLHLALPLDAADQDVRVIVEPMRPPMSSEEWQGWVKAMAGSITDPTFERPLQLPFEERAFQA